jgi:SAM-dependent methyltransferase
MTLDPTQRFTDRVAHYAQSRPSYPAVVLRILEEECRLSPEHVIADVGCGTGLLAALFLRNGNHVYGVEPNDAMRHAAEQALGHYATFTPVAGRAEAITLPDRNVDMVTAAQALHWFEPAATRREFARILKPGGWLVVVRNERCTETSPLLQAVEAATALFRRSPEHGQGWWEVNDELLAGYYGPAGCCHRTCGNEQVVDEEGFLGRWLSQSSLPASGEPGHEEMVDGLRRVFAEHEREGLVAVNYVTHVWVGKLS